MVGLAALEVVEVGAAEYTDVVSSRSNAYWDVSDADQNDRRYWTHVGRSVEILKLHVDTLIYR
jgi:N-glycosylase/DNA lyase